MSELQILSDNAIRLLLASTIKGGDDLKKKPFGTATYIIKLASRGYATSTGVNYDSAVDELKEKGYLPYDGGRRRRNRKSRRKSSRKSSRKNRYSRRN